MTAAPTSVAAPTVDELVRARDWSDTSLGPRDAWTPQLRTILRLMLTSRYAMWMGWGPELSFFYNDAYASQTLGAKHPWALGRSTREVWAEIWNDVGPMVDHVLRTGEATWSEGLLLFLERSGYPEETYHTFSYSPAPGDEPDAIGGLFCVVIEETERVINERRIALLGRFAALLAEAKTRADVFAAVEPSLRSEPRDVPFAALYEIDADGEGGRRVACFGFEGEHAGAPEGFEEASRTWPFGALRGSVEPIVVDLDRELGWPTGPWKTAPRRALVVPIVRGEDRALVAAFVAGLNPHRPLDDGIRNFVQLYVGQLAASLANTVANEQARARAEALTELDRAKTTFFSNVSHELRTPLALMLGPIEDMRASPGHAPEDAERLELLDRNARRLLKLVNTLLEFSRIEAGRVTASFEPTDLAGLTADLASNFRSAVERAGIELILDVLPLREAVFVDRTMWERIVLNLVSNAFKFTFDGSITVRVRDTDDGVELEVVDTGVGIPPHELPRLFERFHRVEGARSRSHEGSGIGLALAHELVRLHGGDVRVSSEPGRGTSFCVRLPKGHAHLSPEHVRAGAPHALHHSGGGGAYVEEALGWLPVDAGPAPSSNDVEWGSRPHIVVADDNADMRAYVTRLLREQWDVTSTRDGRDALDVIEARRPDLVVADVMMPHLDGFGLLAAIRARPELAATPVILLSARAGEEATADALRAGANDYVVKPFSSRDLMVRVAARLAEARAARHEAEQRENLFRHFMQAPFAIAVLRGPTHVIELANGACLAAWGKSEEVVGKPLLAALPELVGQPFPALLDQVLRTGRAHEEREALARLATGQGGAMEEAFFSYVYAPLFDRHGAVEGVLLAAFDVTSAVTARRASDAEKARAAAAQRVALQEAERVNRAKDEFLATMSHELRTPLNAILGWASILTEDASDPARVEHGLSVIGRNARAQSRLVNDLLDVSRIISGKLTLTLAPLVVGSIVQAAVDVARPSAGARGIRLDVDVAADCGTLVADADRLQQILWNLLSNAVRFTREGGRIEVRGRRRDRTLELSVADTGAGLEPDELTRIFNRFHQVDSSITRKHGGLGLGLAIVRHLVEAHGGEIRAESAGLGAGSTFTVTLPLHASPSADPEGTRTTPESGGAAVAAGALQGVRVLVVDDDEDSLELLRIQLETAGANVTTARSMSDALAVSGELDVLISDIAMPDHDGYELLARWKGRASSARVPAIALTAHARDADAKRALDAGFVAHQAKPVDIVKLVEVVRARLVGA
jgi:signal transduction histidine kinase